MNATKRTSTKIEYASWKVGWAGLITILLLVLAGQPRLVAVTAILVAAALAALTGAWAWYWVTCWWTGEYALIRRIYEHVDDQIRAGQYEARRAARLVQIMDFFGGRWRGAIRPAHRSGDVQVTRAAHYILLGFRGARPLRPFQHWRREDIETITIRWTSEAAVYMPSFFDNLERRLAQALGRPYTEGMFDRDTIYPLDMVVFRVRQDVRVPDQLSVAEDLNEG